MAPVPDRTSHRADTSVKHGRVFTYALRRATRTLFSSQGTTDLLSVQAKVVIRG